MSASLFKIISIKPSIKFDDLPALLQYLAILIVYIYLQYLKNNL